MVVHERTRRWISTAGRQVRGRRCRDRGRGPRPAWSPTATPPRRRPAGSTQRWHGSGTGSARPNAAPVGRTGPSRDCRRAQATRAGRRQADPGSGSPGAPWVRLRRTGSRRGSGRSSAPGVPVDEAALLAAPRCSTWTGMRGRPASRSPPRRMPSRTTAGRERRDSCRRTHCSCRGRNPIRRKRLPPPRRLPASGRDTGRCPIRAGTSRRTSAGARAARHTHGPLGHLAERLTDSTVLDVHGLAGPTACAGVRPRPGGTWLCPGRPAAARTAAFSATPPDDTALPDLAPVEHTPETLVSIVIPSWNRSALLQRALASVRAQTWSHWEALVVDDGSEDDTREVVAALAAEDPRIRLIARPHEGVCAARNAGLAEARGGFIAFLDSDNEWLPAFWRRWSGDDGPRHRRGVRGADGDDQRRSALSRQPGHAGDPAGRHHVDLNVLVVRGQPAGEGRRLRRRLAADRRLRPGAPDRRRDRPRLRPGPRRLYDRDAPAGSAPAFRGPGPTT